MLIGARAGGYAEWMPWMLEMLGIVKKSKLGVYFNPEIMSRPVYVDV